MSNNSDAIAVPVIIFVFASIITGSVLLGLLITALVFWLA